MPIKDPEARRAWAAAYHQANKEYRNAQSAIYKAAHKEELLKKDAAYRASHQEQILAYRDTHKEERAASDKLWRYGLTREEWDRMYLKQKGCCAICKKPGPKTGRGCLQVDHNHDTGVVRALLCSPCNRFLGIVENPRPEFLSYLNHHRKKP